MKFNKLNIIFKSVFFVCCCFITTKAEAVCQAETCGQRPSHPPSCGDGDCTPFVNPNHPNYPPENHGTCPADCSAIATCGDGVISNWENCHNCPADVPVCGATCGDTICSSSVGESCLTCSRDCGACGVCGDGVCDCAPNGTETVASCPQDCGPVTTTTSTTTTTTTTTTTVPSCGNGSCERNAFCPTNCPTCNCTVGENSTNCPQDCGTTTTTTTVCGRTCGNGVCETVACSAIGCPNPETVANCPQDCPCPTGQVIADGICCLASKPNNINGICSVCPAGQVERDGNGAVTGGSTATGPCCPPGIPRALNNPRECCPAATPYVHVVPGSIDSLECTASICPTGQVERGGAKAGQCCPAGIPRAANNPAECCPAASPYVFPDGQGGLVCSPCPAGQVERGVPRAGQCCPAGIPRALNNPAECCPAATPYAHPGPTDALVCTASICPAGQVERGGAKAGQCCPAGIPRAANDPAECCPSDIPNVFPDGQGGLVCRATSCPTGQSLVNGVCTVVPICDNHRGTTARYECVTFTRLSNCKGVSKGVSRHAYTPDGQDVEVWCHRGSNQGHITPVITGNVICACIRVIGCFHPQTQISLVDGSTKKAENVSVDDTLLNPLTGKGYRVLSVVESREQAALIEFGYADTKLKVSDGHAVLLEGGKLKKAKDLVVGDKVLGADKKYHQLGFVNKLQVEAGQRVINFNLETDSKDTNDHILLSDGIATGDLFVQGVLKDKK